MSGQELNAAQLRERLVDDVVKLAELIGDDALSRKHLAALLSDDTLQRLLGVFLTEYVDLF